MSYNPNYKFIIEVHLKVGLFFIPLLTAPELLQWSSLGRAFGFSAQIYLLRPCSYLVLCICSP